MAEATVSLYLELEEGAVADIEVVAKAALAFSKAVKDVAYIIDPSLELRVELASGTRGSLSLNSIFRNLKKANGETITLSAIGLVVLGWFGATVSDFGKDELKDIIKNLFHQEEQFTPAQQAQLKAIVTKAINEKAAAPHVQQVYRELERDPAIKGVGATPKAGDRPAVIVPRRQFAERAGERIVQEEANRRRTTTDRVHVALISPVLVPGDRKWRLQSAHGEFGASIKDKQFVDMALSGRLAIPLATGIEMDVQLETIEDFKEGVWVVHDRNVLHVYIDSLKTPLVPLPLPFPNSDEHKPPNDGQ
jgi:hypothetical protein